MQMYPGAGYTEHRYKVEKEDYAFSDDFRFNKNSGMNKLGHLNPGSKHNYIAADHHLHDRVGPNMHMMKNPDHYPNSNKHGYYYGPNKNGMNYSETIYEQEETQYHANKFDDHYSGRHGGGVNNYNNNNNNKHFNSGGDPSYYYASGAPSYGGMKEHGRYYPDGRMKAPVTWDCKGIDD